MAKKPVGFSASRPKNMVDLATYKLINLAVWSPRPSEIPRNPIRDRLPAWHHDAHVAQRIARVHPSDGDRDTVVRAIGAPCSPVEPALAVAGGLEVYVDATCAWNVYRLYRGLGHVQAFLEGHGDSIHGEVDLTISVVSHHVTALRSMKAHVSEGQSNQRLILHTTFTHVRRVNISFDSTPSCCRAVT